jgi:hypothetical protein
MFRVCVGFASDAEATACDRYECLVGGGSNGIVHGTYSMRSKSCWLLCGADMRVLQACEVATEVPSYSNSCTGKFNGPGKLVYSETKE